MNILIGIIIFLLLILIHEFGHFIVAKRVGIKVNEFSIGMGPALWKKQGGETLYALRALPIGGYCAMEGEDEASMDPRAFDSAGPWQRIAVIFAGAGFNFLSAYLVLLLIGGLLGTPLPFIGGFTENSPAKEAGLQVGDRILFIDQSTIETWEDIALAVEKGADDGQVVLVYEREGQEMTSQVKVAREDLRYIIGITPARQRSIGTAFSNANQIFFGFLGSMFSFLGQAIRGGIGLQDVSGPVGVVTMIGQAIDMGALSVMMFFAFLAINLGFFNLLPFPALDGGRIILILIEILRGKALPKDKEGILNLIGIGLLLGLMVVVLFNDIVKLVR